jgi:predicted transcriptional regulator
MQIMADKGLVDRDERQKAHVYQARASEDHTQSQLVSDLLDRAFDGSPTRLAMHALSAKKSSKAELAELRRLLDALEGGKR